MKPLLYISVIVFTFIFLFQQCHNTSAPADLVLTNGRIYSVEDSNLVYQAIALKRDKILSVGSVGDIKSHIKTSTTVIDLKGKTVIPGFIDSHAHFMNLGYLKLNLDLNQTSSWSEIVEIVKSAVKNAKPGAWIEGRGWHQEKWKAQPDMMVEQYPVHKQLSAISPNNPVYLKHASGHAILVNQKAMDLARVTMSTANPPGGRTRVRTGWTRTRIRLRDRLRLLYCFPTTSTRTWGCTPTVRSAAWYGVIRTVADRPMRERA